MTWNWQQKDWPQFTYEEAALEALEAQFLRQSGVWIGAHRHIRDDDKDVLKIELLSNEALKTSEIEGEYLDRESLQSSLRRHFNLATDNRKIPPAEKGIAEMMVDLYGTFADPLESTSLFRWHSMLTLGRRDLKDIGRYRTDAEPMQIVSGPIGNQRVHFEAPPSKNIAGEMRQYISWFNQTSPNGSNPLPALTRSGIAHLYFVSIHPFEDGNGRIGRAIAEKALSQSLGQPTLIALSHAIQSQRKAYYSALESGSRTNEITNWLTYFAKTILSAQEYTQTLIDFLIEKTQFYDKFKDQMNERQQKVIARVFREGPKGFEGGLSAENYIRITGTSRATATRDLKDLVEKGALLRTGELKSARYSLKLR